MGGASETGKKKGLLWMGLVMAACLASDFAGSSASSIGAATSASMLEFTKHNFCVIIGTDLQDILDHGICTQGEAIALLSCGEPCIIKPGDDDDDDGDGANPIRATRNCLYHLADHTECN